MDKRGKSLNGVSGHAAVLLRIDTGRTSQRRPANLRHESEASYTCRIRRHLMVTGVAWSPDSRFVACCTQHRVSIYQAGGQKQLDLIPLGMTSGLAVSPTGHIRTQSDDQFAYVQTADGQVTVRPQEMAARWGWKNDPRSAQLPAP